MLGAYYESTGEQLHSASVDIVQNTESAIKELRSEWGKSYDGNVDLAKRAMLSACGGDQERVALIGRMEMKDGRLLGDHPDIIKAFSALGSKMSEHGLVGAKTTQFTKSPADATTEKRRLQADNKFMEAWLDGGHIDHAAAVQKMNSLTEMEVAG